MASIFDCTKVYIPDTSIMMHDPDALEYFSKDLNNNTVIPLCTLEEIDRHKHEQGERGVNSRRVVRWLDGLRQKHKKSLKDGIQIGRGKGFIQIDHNGENIKELSSDLAVNNDNRILAMAKHWQERVGDKAQVIIVTKDINMRVKADALGILAEDYKRDKRVDCSADLYSGYAEIKVLPAEMGGVTTLSMDGFLPVKSLYHSLQSFTLYPNQCCRLNFGEKYLLAIFKKEEEIFRQIEKPKETNRLGKNILPINDRQSLGCGLLEDTSLSLITINGKAGTGKSLISFLSGYQQLDKNIMLPGPENKKYIKRPIANRALHACLMIYKSIVEVGEKTVGFLPGDLQEKMEPWKQAIYDNLGLILKEELPNIPNSNSVKNAIDIYMTKGLIEIGPISFIRGRSINNAFIIVDEAQNLTPHEIKTLITRVGKGSKIVLIGDTEQIDNPYLDPTSNGLSRTIEVFKDQPLAGHITLVEGERSDLAELAANLL